MWPTRWSIIRTTAKIRYIVTYFYDFISVWQLETSTDRLVSMQKLCTFSHELDTILKEIEFISNGVFFFFTVDT